MANIFFALRTFLLLSVLTQASAKHAAEFDDFKARSPSIETQLVAQSVTCIENDSCVSLEEVLLPSIATIAVGEGRILSFRHLMSF